MNRLLIGPQNKTDLLLQLHSADPITLIDTTGEVASAFANRAKVNQTLYFDPSDIQYPVGLNVFDRIQDHQQFAEQITDYIFHLFPAGASTLTRENAQFLLENCIRILLVMNGPQTLLTILKLLSNRTFRDECLLKCKDPVVLSNWEALHALESKTQQALFFSLRTKLGKLLNDPVLRNIVGQPYNTFGNVSIIANLDRSKIGNARAKFLGGLLIARSTGHVVITDYGFFGLPVPLEQERFTVCLDFIDELPPALRQPALGIDDKYVFKTNKKDAEELSFYVDAPNPRKIMDLDGNVLSTNHGSFAPAAPPSLRHLKPLKKHTRACHTRPRLQVERDIKTYLEG
jgi:hypothetical protein